MVLELNPGAQAPSMGSLLYLPLPGYRGGPVYVSPVPSAGLDQKLSPASSSSAPSHQGPVQGPLPHLYPCIPARTFSVFSLTCLAKYPVCHRCWEVCSVRANARLCVTATHLPLSEGNVSLGNVAVLSETPGTGAGVGAGCHLGGLCQVSAHSAR